MILKTGWVVGDDGRIKEVVAYKPDTKEIEFYEMKEGETLVEDGPFGLLKPLWNPNRKVWEETASQKELEEREKENNKKPPVEVSKEEIMLGMTSMYEEMLKKDTENKMALAELYESMLK